MKFSIEILEQASQGYHNLKKQIRKKIESNIIVNSTEKTDQYYTKIFSSLLDDLNMPSALSEFWKMVKDPEISSVDTKFLVEEFDKIAGLNLLVEDLEEETLSDIPQDIQKLLQDREMAKKNKDW
ncbi:MAG: hypothetical protein LBD75_08240 [Candidatus Peribacteria bacterium]|jgi:cysteinyl-tRNA synthetase|nr:hypothetical protein [Candidatus Peribacteria bacterium]